MPVKACVFDAYGTLFDVAAAAREAAGEPGREAFAEKWTAVAETWRLKQLAYTWLRAAADAHTDFWSVTGQALDYALALHGLEDADLRERLLALYWELQAYPEVPQMLAALKEAGHATAILSNGSPPMLKGAVDNAGIGGMLDAVLSVEDVGVFKPDARVYAMVTDHFGIDADQVLFVSSNCWDACCATGFGFVTVWANRKGEPVDPLPWQPVHTVADLTPIPDIAGAA